VSPTPALAKRFVEARREVFETGEPVAFSIEWPTAAGLRCVEYRMVPERAADGSIVSAVAIGRDVTRQEALEGALRESERRMATLLRNLPGMAYRMRDDADWTAEFVSDGVQALTGYAPRELLPGGRITYEEIIQPSDRERVRAAVHAALAAGVSFELTYHIVRADGATRWVWEQGREVPSPEGGPRMLEGLVIDVTDREESRLALEAERARLAEAQRIAGVGSWTWDAITGSGWVSDQWLRGFRLGPEAGRDPMGAFISLLAPDERPRFEERRLEIIRDHPEFTDGRWCILRPDGVRQTVHSRSVWRYDADGRLVAGSGTIQDVTQEAEAEAHIARQQALLEESQRLAHVGSWEWELATDTVTWSDEMYTIAGLAKTGEPMTRTRVRALVHPDDFPGMKAGVDAVIATGEAMEQEFRFVRPDGSVRLIQARTRAVADASGATQRVVGSCQDVTDRRRLEEQVRQAQKLEALGLLAGGVAHDFNNLLSAIIGGVELAREAVGEGSRAADDLEDARLAAVRAAQITGQLLAFSRKQVRRPRVLDLRATVRAAGRLLRRLLPESVALDLAPGTEPCVVRADPVQLEQVLMNLVLNARDAILAAAPPPVSLAARGTLHDAAGVVTVETARVTLTADDPRGARPGAEPLPAGEYAALLVRDSGVGIDAATLAHVFEPFFTTKGAGEGTGLGLATVLGIAAQNGGAVSAASAPGVGTTFTVLLPLVDAPLDVVGTSTSALPGGTETILLAEDEGVVRETAKRILERHGYRVIAARHGADAVLAWQAHRGAVDAVVTDLRMPAMGGEPLVAWLRAQQPALPVVVMSGYASGSDPAEAELLAREPFLAKPFSTESLLVAMREALDRRRP
jgi:PAS domain S-box-containing protein